jgi:hypothetical protein
MCLYVDHVKTKTFKTINNSKHIYTFYKLFKIDDGFLLTPFQKTKIKNFGIIKADTSKYYNYLNNYDNAAIESGACHAYCIPVSSISNYICLPVYVKYENVIAFGRYDDVCFTQYEIKEKHWNKLKFKFFIMKIKSFLDINLP